MLKLKCMILSYNDKIVVDSQHFLVLYYNKNKKMKKKWNKLKIQLKFRRKRENRYT